MARRALIIVEGASNGALFVQAARRLGLHPIVLSADPSQYNYVSMEKDEIVRVNTNDVSALIWECSRIRANCEISGITSSWESFYATVGKLCRHFDLPGPNPSSVERCCDKVAQRQLLAEAGVPLPAYRAAVNATEIESAAAEIGLPVVLKPAVGSGSSGVRLCRNVDELAEHASFLLDGKHPWRSSPRMLVEEFAEGPYYSVEIMGSEVIGISAGDFGSPPHFVFRGYTYPARLTDEERQRIADVCLSCLRGLSLGWGPMNVELRWTKRGPVVIEVNPRLAGTPIPQLVQAADGIDLITEHIKLVIGEKWDLRKRQSNTARAQLLVPDRDGILDWLEGASRAAAEPGIVEVKLFTEPKTLIVRRGDYRDCIGHVIAASRGFAQTEAILQRAVGFIDWSIKPNPSLDG
ncbi:MULTISPECIES: acetyl-CoA carboxylase biotin carboxylase subunit family protein [Mesorhizobium]|uniref:ATP-grasp domain-containing protein n=1 Tax=Mesorhizobium TaxID=68287 RepID=UPI000A02F3C0|nr:MULTISPECIES: acetyl-CoA carboxylase biotin carboxylase subunit family protein [Mesorhizobium]WJI38389.1 acetyl-CoA carboxylase biotin carboxylase subunit family protein [Mesorhizobium opportunistum]